MSRHKDVDWTFADKVENWEQAGVAVLMDLRDELKEMRQSLSVLQCRNFLNIPYTLRRIANNTAESKRFKKFYEPSGRRRVR